MPGVNKLRGIGLLLGALAQRTAGGATRAGRSAGRAAVRLFDQAVIEDYRRSLAEMRARGFDRYAARVVRPYLATNLAVVEGRSVRSPR